MIRRWLAKILGLELPKLTAEPGPEYEYMGYTVVDGETGMTLSVMMVCGCGNPVVVAGQEETNFWCEHCDRGCTEDKPCPFCEAHYMFDAEAAKAGVSDFNYEEEEEQD